MSWRRFKVKKRVVIIQPATLLVEADAVVGLPPNWELVFSVDGGRTMLLEGSREFHECFEIVPAKDTEEKKLK